MPVPQNSVLICLGEERAALRTFLRDRVSPIELPVRVEIRDTLPKTTIGKLSRKELVAKMAAPKAT